MRLSVLFIVIGLLLSIPGVGYCESFKKEIGEHFILYYPDDEEVSWAKEIIRYAEKYYSKIADQIGYSRYDNFWTWEERVKILVYPDQKTFGKETGQPVWSSGVTVRDDKILQTKIIATFRQENEFLTGVLPHEISHLIIRDYLGNRPIPIWFDEGMAQLQEAHKKAKADQAIRILVKNKQHIPLRELFSITNIHEDDELKVIAFYAESMSILDFLITKYGSSNFAQLCSELKNGKSFEEALRAAYTPTFYSIDDLEDKWLRYISNR